jgi:RNA polymerase sigma factor (sigma-70 family)
MPYKYEKNDKDELLLRGCSEEHPLAQKYLYQRYFGRLLTVTYRYANDRQEAVGILNQAFLKIFQSIHRYQPSGTLYSWMRTIVFRTALNHIRSQMVFENIETLDNLPPLSIEADFNGFDTEYLLNAIQKLPMASRTVFSLYEIDGYQHAEIAQILNISIGTSKWHLSEAKSKLRLILMKNGQKSIKNHETT